MESTDSFAFDDFSGSSVVTTQEEEDNEIATWWVDLFEKIETLLTAPKKDSFSDLKHLSLEDFIAREVDDKIFIKKGEDKIIKDKVVLVTGAGGSIGSVLSKQVLANKPKLLIIIDNSEFALFKIESDLKRINSDKGRGQT